MMGVQGYLSLYTTVFGWLQYQNLWDLMTQTGLMYAPFLVMIVRNFHDPVASQMAKGASSTALHRTVLDVGMMTLVVMVAAVPMVTLTPSQLHYTPLCEQRTKTVTGSHSGTTFDGTFTLPTSVKVPVWWYAVIAFSNGLTDAAMVGTPCNPNFSDLQTTLDLSSIQDAALRNAVNEFYNECYVPARSKFLRENPQAPTVSEAGDRSDTEWMGSHTYDSTPGYYDTFKATQPVPGFPYSPSRDFEYTVAPTWGTPTCKQWWDDSSQGLHERLLHVLPETVWQRMAALGFPSTSATIQDQTIKTLLSHSEVEGSSPDYTSFSDHPIGKTASYAGVWMVGLAYYPMLATLTNALPMLQGVLLGAMYMLLPMGLVFSRYRVSFLVAASLAIFSVTFWSYLWYLANGLQDVLLPALYPNGTLFFEKNSNNARTMALIVGGMYIGFPMIWSVMMGWFGQHALAGLNSVMGQATSPASEAGHQVSHLTRSVATMGLGKLVRKIK